MSLTPAKLEVLMLDGEEAAPMAKTRTIKSSRFL